MTDASFTAAGYAILTEDDPNQKYISVTKSYEPIAYVSKTFTPSQLKMSIYAKEFLAIFYAFKEFGHTFCGSPQPVIILTDNKLVTRFFQTKIIPPPLWNACDFVNRFNFIIAHIPGKNTTAEDYLSRMAMDPTEKLVLKIREDVETRPIEVNVQSAGVSEEEQVFLLKKTMIQKNRFGNERYKLKSYSRSLSHKFKLMQYQKIPCTKSEISKSESDTA